MWTYLRRFHSDEDGAIAVMFAVFLFVLVGFAALAIDMGYSFATRTDLQVTASAAAHAGVQVITDADDNDIPDTGDYRRVAVEYAYRNMPATTHGNILEPICGTYDPGTGTVSGDTDLCEDVQAGNWNPDTRTFCAWDNKPPFDCYDPATMALDAVRVDAYRSEKNDNPLNLILAPVVGLAQASINAHAIAWTPVEGAAAVEARDCYQTGVIAMGVVDLDSRNDLTEGMCVYGDKGVKIQSDLCFEGAGDPEDDPPVPTSCDSSNPPITSQVQLMTPGPSGPD